MMPIEETSSAQLRGLRPEDMKTVTERLGVRHAACGMIGRRRSRGTRGCMLSPHVRQRTRAGRFEELIVEQFSAGAVV